MTRSKPVVLSFGLALAAVLVLAACGRSPTDKGAGNAGGPEATPSANEAAKGFLVVQIDDEIRVIPKASLAALKQELKTEDDQALARYDAEQQAAEKSNVPFDKPMPLRRKVRRSETTFATEQEAAAYRDKLLEKRKAAAERTAAKKPAKRKAPSAPPAEPPEPEEGGDEGGQP